MENRINIYKIEYGKSSRKIWVIAASLVDALEKGLPDLKGLSDDELQGGITVVLFRENATI